MQHVNAVRVFSLNRALDAGDARWMYYANITTISWMTGIVWRRMRWTIRKNTTNSGRNTSHNIMMTYFFTRTSINYYLLIGDIIWILGNRQGVAS